MIDYVAFMTEEQIERFQKFKEEKNITQPLNEFVGSLIQLIKDVGEDNMREWMKSCENRNI